MVYHLHYHKSPVCKRPEIHHCCWLGDPDNYGASPQYYLMEISWDEMGAYLTYNADGITANTRQHELIPYW